MKIDIGTGGGHRYPTPAYYVPRAADDPVATEEPAKTRSLNISMGRSYLSSSLSSALLTVERVRKGVDAAAAEEHDGGASNGIVNRYLEFSASSSDEVH